MGITDTVAQYQSLVKMAISSPYLGFSYVFGEYLGL